MKMVVALHEDDVSRGECHDDDAHVQIMVDRQENQPEGDCQLQKHIYCRDKYMGHLQLVGHQLIGMLAMSLAQILPELNPMTDSQDGIGSVYSEKGKVRQVAGIENQSSECEEQNERHTD